MFTKMGTDVESIKMKGGLELLAAVKSASGVNNATIQKSMEMDRNESSATANQAQTASKTGTDISDQTTSKNVQGLKTHAAAAISAIPDLLKTLSDDMSSPLTPEAQAQQQEASRVVLARELQTARGKGTTASTTVARAAGGIQSATSSQQMHAAMAHTASTLARKTDTTAASGASTTPKNPPGANKQPIVVNANVYVDGKLIQSHQSHQVAQDLGNHSSNPGN